MVSSFLSSPYTRKFGIIAIFLAIQLVAFLAVNMVHFNFFRVSVILYACIIDIILASALTVLAWKLVVERWFMLDPVELSLSAIIGVLALLVYSIMGPTVIDRSLSLYIVEKLDHRGGEFSEEAFPEMLNREFMQEYSVADVRLTEQVTSGTAVIEDGCIRLTGKGRALSGLTGFYRKHFLPKKRVIRGVVTDRLTDPLRDSPVLVPYSCPPAQEE